MAETVDMLEAARWYNSHGFSILPVHWPIGDKCSCRNPKCKEAGKHPNCPHGHLDATTDLDKIIQWWTECPEANIGLKLDRHLVVDGDPRNGGPAERTDLIERFGATPETAEQITGGLGRHWFFKRPGGVTEVPPNIGPGVDLKGPTGYVIVEPSLHISGRRYSFDGVEGREALLHAAEPPDWLLDLIKSASRNGKPAPPAGKIPKGKQHYFLVKLAGHMRNGGAEFDEIFEALKTANKTRCTEPGPEKNIRKIAESILKYRAGKVYLGTEEPDGKPESDIPKSDEPPLPPEPPDLEAKASRRAGPKTQKPKIEPVILTLDDVVAMELPEPKTIIDNIQPESGATLNVGAPKAGKTILGIQKAMSIASGRAFLDFYRVHKTGPVMLVEQDDPAGNATLKQICEKTKIPVPRSSFHVVTGTEFSLGLDFTEWLATQIERFNLVFVMLDSYTALRAGRSGSSDIVKQEAFELSQLDKLAKDRHCAIDLVHHHSKGSAALDWSEKAAGTYAMAASTEAQIAISRYPDLEINAPERHVRVRGRHLEGVEMVLRFDAKTLGFFHVLEGGAASFYPQIQQMKTCFGAAAFTPKQVTGELGVSRATAHRMLSRLIFCGAIARQGYGEYVMGRST